MLIMAVVKFVTLRVALYPMFAGSTPPQLLPLFKVLILPSSLSSSSSSWGRVFHYSERGMSFRGRGEDRSYGRRRGGALIGGVPRGGTSSRPRRISAKGGGGPEAGLVSSPVMAAGETTPSATDTPAVLVLFEDARRGAELIGRALGDWDTFMFRDLLPNPAADQY
ncbi:hypothetical protein U1Q18_052627 [Sarracenia purpurea var. burkii]